MLSAYAQHILNNVFEIGTVVISRYAEHALIIWKKLLTTPVRTLEARISF
jgi:hypothetical protein